jgi:hypothetical protein
MNAPDIAKHRAGESLRIAMENIQRERHARPPVDWPMTEKIYIPLGADTQALVEITIQTRGLGHIDPSKRRAATTHELHRVAVLLHRRCYQFHESTD